MACINERMHKYLPTATTIFAAVEHTPVETQDFNFDDNKRRSFKVLDILGKGAYGFVFKAEYTSCQIGSKKTSVRQLVAMKIQQDSRMSQREYIVHEKLSKDRQSCQYIPDFVDFWVTDSLAVSVTEFCRGGTLHDYLLQSNSKPQWIIRKKLADDILQATEYLHSRGVFHNDLKPDNILLQFDSTRNQYRAVLTDFGMASASFFPENNHAKSYHGASLFKSPELFTKTDNELESITWQPDVWALGIILSIMVNVKYEGPWYSAHKNDDNYQFFLRRALAGDFRSRLHAMQILLGPLHNSPKIAGLIVLALNPDYKTRSTASTLAVTAAEMHSVEWLQLPTQPLPRVDIRAILSEYMIYSLNVHQLKM